MLYSFALKACCLHYSLSSSQISQAIWEELCESGKSCSLVWEKGQVCCRASRVGWAAPASSTPLDFWNHTLLCTIVILLFRTNSAQAMEAIREIPRRVLGVSHALQHTQVTKLHNQIRSFGAFHSVGSQLRALWMHMLREATAATLRGNLLCNLLAHALCCRLPVKFC